MKKNTKLLIIVGVLLLVVVGASFAYYIAKVKINGAGSNITGNTERMIEVVYDAKNGKLATDNMYPGVTESKEFTVTVTPGSVINEATYIIKLNIAENTFEYCTDENYDEITNACEKNIPELIYTLKDSAGNIISTDDITGKTGTIELARETKVVTEKTVFTYTLEITNVETNADQNHNAGKTINGEVTVELGEKGILAKDIIDSLEIKESPTEFTGIADTDEGVFKAQDDDGETYYWRGAVTNNYVKFAGYYWRIIRINGDGTIRLIYQGPSATSTGTDAQIGTSAFNSSYNDNKYVGFKYTSNDVHGTGTESTILTSLNSWYETNLDKTGIKEKIDQNAGFCNDRYPSTSSTTSNGSGGTSTTTTYYGAYIRFIPGGSWGTTQKPTFKCKDSRDLFTKSGAVKKDGTANGNRALTNPIGLITADEVVYAGGFGGKANSSYYLYTGQVYWTLSPSFYNSSYANVFIVSSTGNLRNSRVDSACGVRPVINLKADTLFNEDGKGTIDNPYVVKT